MAPKKYFLLGQRFKFLHACLSLKIFIATVIDKREYFFVKKHFLGLLFNNKDASSVMTVISYKQKLLFNAKSLHDKYKKVICFGQCIYSLRPGFLRMS